MTPVKFLAYVLQVKNKIAGWEKATAFFVAAILICLGDVISDWSKPVQLILFLTIIIVYYVFWGIINYKVDEKVRGMLKDKIDEEAYELAEALMHQRIYKRSQIIPILKKLIDKYGEENLDE